MAPQVRCEDRPGAAPNSSLPVRRGHCPLHPLSLTCGPRSGGHHGTRATAISRRTAAGQARKLGHICTRGSVISCIARRLAYLCGHSSRMAYAIQKSEPERARHIPCEPGSGDPAPTDPSPDQGAARSSPTPSDTATQHEPPRMEVHRWNPLPPPTRRRLGERARREMRYVEAIAASKIRCAT